MSEAYMSQARQSHSGSPHDHRNTKIAANKTPTVLKSYWQMLCQYTETGSRDTFVALERNGNWPHLRSSDSHRHRHKLVSDSSKSCPAHIWTGQLDTRIPDSSLRHSCCRSHCHRRTHRPCQYTCPVDHDIRIVSMDCTGQPYNYARLTHHHNHFASHLIK